MTPHTRILEFPHTRSLINARLDDLREETHGARRELIFDYQELWLLEPPELIALDEQPHERLRGEYIPRRLRFLGVRWVKSEGAFTHLADIAPTVLHILGLPVPTDMDGRALTEIIEQPGEVTYTEPYRAIALRITNPRRGIHYYLRRGQSNSP